MKTRNLISRAALKVGLSNDPISKKSKDYLRSFNKWSFKGNKCIDEKQYEAVITRWYHTIEKGLAYINYRAGFGKKNIAALLESMENYLADGYSDDAFFYKTALSVLRAYVEKNKQYGVEDEDLEARISKLSGSPNDFGGIISFTPKSDEELGNMNYEELVLTRHSIRHFSDEPVDADRICKAVKLAQYTPSACNRQGWRTIVVEDKNKIEQLLKNQNGNEGFGQEFDKLILVTADLRCFNNGRELHQAFIDGGMYAQSLLNALYYEHIATVPLSASLREDQEKSVRNILHLHDAEVLIMFIGIGNYPNECRTTRSERKPVELTMI